MNDCSSEQPSIPNGIRNDEDDPISVESKSLMTIQAHRRVCVLTCFAATNHAEPNVTAIRPSCDPFVEGVGASEGPRAADPKESLDEPESMDVDCSGGGSLEYFGSPCTDGEEMLAGSHLSGEEFFRCQWTDCTRGFPLLEELITHVNDDHVKLEKETDYSCRWKGCARRGKAFNARYKMLIHVRTHTNEKPHRCCECGKSFSRLENLKIHNRSHTGEKPYICPMVGCNKAYSNSSDRFKHTRTHYVDKPYACKKEGCDKRYTDPSSLRKHMKTYGHYGDGRDVLALASRSSGDCQRGSAGNVVVSDRTMDGSAVDEHRRLVKCLTKIQQDLVRTSSSLFTVSVASAMMADSVKNCDDVTANGGRCDGALNSVPRKAPDGRSSIGPRSSDKCRDDKYQSNPLDLTIGHPENVS